MDVPSDDDLAGMSVAVTRSDEPGVVTVVAWADDGGLVSLTWDEIARSVRLRWEDHDDARLVLERETISKVSVREVSGQVEFRVWSEVAGLRGQLVAIVGGRVTVSDAILRW